MAAAETDKSGISDLTINIKVHFRVAAGMISGARLEESLTIIFEVGSFRLYCYG
jgi:hypothetical protein